MLNNRINYSPSLSLSIVSIIHNSLRPPRLIISRQRSQSASVHISLHKSAPKTQCPEKRASDQPLIFPGQFPRRARGDANWRAVNEWRSARRAVTPRNRRSFITASYPATSFRRVSPRREEAASNESSGGGARRRGVTRRQSERPVRLL